MVMETAAKLNYFPTKGGCSNYFSPREILHHVKVDYKNHCSVPLLSYVLTLDEPTLTNTVHTFALDCLSLHAIQTKQGGYECIIFPLARLSNDLTSLSFPQTPAIIATIDALSISDSN